MSKVSIKIRKSKGIFFFTCVCKYYSMIHIYSVVSTNAPEMRMVVKEEIYGDVDARAVLLSYRHFSSPAATSHQPARIFYVTTLAVCTDVRLSEQLIVDYFRNQLLLIMCLIIRLTLFKHSIMLL